MIAESWLSQNWILWLVVGLHLAWGFIALFDPEMGMTQSTIAQLQRMLGLPLWAVGLVFIGAAAISLWGLLAPHRRADMRVLLLLPQQMVMVFILAGLIDHLFTPSPARPNYIGLVNSGLITAFHTAGIFSHARR